MEAMRQCIIKSWISYCEEFYAHTSSPQNVEGDLANILTDTLGFIGVWILFLSVACPVDVFGAIPLTDNDKVQLAQKNLLHTAISSLQLFFVRTRSSKTLRDSSDFPYDITHLLSCICEGAGK